MSSAALRSTMAPLVRRTRAYLAPIDRATNTPAVFDPGKYGWFDLDAAPSPWLDLGWIENFKRTPATRLTLLRAGAKGAAQAQFRSGLEARVELEFREWGKLQMALAGGSQNMNVLATQSSADAVGSGGSAVDAVPALPGSNAAQVVVGAGIVDGFDAGDLIAVDADYQQQTGYVGSGIPGAYVKDPVDVLRDKDYVRRVTFNVARVASKTSNTLMLAQPLPAGIPANALVQRVVAFVDREGGSFFQEWSAVFVLEPYSGGRVCFHYPRLQAAAPAAESAYQLDALEGAALKASFLALSHHDINDGEDVLCYRSYFPAAGAEI